MEIWFNPKCSKCRLAVEALDEAGIGYDVRRYLDEPPTAEQLAQTLDALGLEPWDITRMSEPLAAELGLSDLPRDRDRWIAQLVAHPVLIQRPIITLDDGSAWVARDPDSLRAVVDRAQSTS